MRLASVTVHDHRTVWGEPVQLQLGSAVTVLVGPNLAGKSNLARALAAALDPQVPFDVERERPAHLADAVPQVDLAYRDRAHGRTGRVDVRVSWPAGTRVVDVRPGSARPPDGRPVLAWAADRPADVLARVADVVADEPPEALAADLLPTLRRVLTEVAAVELPEGPGGDVVVRDRSGFAVGDHVLRATFAAAVAAHLVRRGVELPGVVIEEPEAFLHPAAQEVLRDELLEVGVAADAPVLVTTESAFMVPRVEETRVLAVARDDAGRTRVVGGERGDQPQAAMLGGLFRDPGLAAVLDRTTQLHAGTTGVLVVEGGTDEAYLRAAADVLGRGDELATLAIHAAGGALPAALLALVLRAETDVPILALLDNDEAGRRAKRTLVSRFGFTNRREVTTYAEVIEGHPMGAEAEDVFDWRLVARFVDDQGEDAIRDRRVLVRDEWHFDLTLAAKSAFVAWVEREVRPEHCARWGQLLDLLGERLGPGAATVGIDGTDGAGR